MSFVWSHCVGDMSRRNCLSFSRGPDCADEVPVATMADALPLGLTNEQVGP